MSLADELLNDLDGLSDDGGPEETEERNVAGPSSGTMGPPAPLVQKRSAPGDDDEEDEDMDAGATMANGASAVGYVAAGGVKPAEELDREEVDGMDLKTVQDVESVVKLHKSKKLQDALSVSLAITVAL